MKTKIDLKEIQHGSIVYELGAWDCFFLGLLTGLLTVITIWI